MHAQGRPLTRQIDLNLLELFDTVFKTRNLTASGARLGLSQPAVSYGLAKLREMYGDALFVRMQRGVQPTPFAEQLAEPVAAALQIVRGTIEKTTFAPAEAQRIFRVAMTDIGERFFLPRLSQRLAAEAPGVVIETLSPRLAELSDGLASGDIDLAIGFIPGLGKQVYEQPLFHEHFVYLMRSGHPASRGTLTMNRLRNLRHVVASAPGTQHLAAVEKVLRSPRVRAHIALRVRSFLCVGPIVADTDLVSPVPSNLALLVSRGLKLKMCPPPIKFPPFDISTYWHRRFHQDPGLLWLRTMLVELFSDSKSPTEK